MIAEVEKPDGTYERIEMGAPECGTYCDTCGDCLHCYPHDDEDWCVTGERWVIYKDDPGNPLVSIQDRDPASRSAPSVTDASGQSEVFPVGGDEGVA